MRKLAMVGLAGWAAMLMQVSTVKAQGQGDVLNESPLAPIPQEMSYEEYRAMNRRLTVGLALKAIPVPGMLHFYAGDSKTGKRLLTTSLLGVASIMAGAILVGEGDFPSTDFEVMVLNAGDKDEERRYEKIPVRLEGEATHYRLRELERDGDLGIGGPLIALGVAVIVYDFVYDFVHGVRVIEEKRDRVRFKYGQQLKLQMSMRGDRGAPSPGLALNYTF